MTRSKYAEKHGYQYNDLCYLFLRLSIDIASGCRVGRKFMEAISIVCSSFCCVAFSCWDHMPLFHFYFPPPPPLPFRMVRALEERL
jgi:hypothetical protein